MVLVSIWPSRAMMVLIVILFFWIILKNPRTADMEGKSSHLGAVSCRDYENGLGGHMAIKRHDGPNSYLLFLNYSQLKPEQLWIWGRHAISLLCHVETMTMVLVTIWQSRDMMVLIVFFFLWIIVNINPNSYVFGEVRPSRRCVISRLWKLSLWPYGHQGPWWSK